MPRGQPQCRIRWEPLDGQDTPAKMRTLRTLGVPYTDEQTDGAIQAVSGEQEITTRIIAFALWQLWTLLPAGGAHHRH